MSKPPPAKPRFRHSRKLLASGAAVILLALAALALARPLLCVDTGPAHRAEVIVVLGGSVFDRAPRAAELFKAGLARRIIVTGDGDCDENRRELVAEGVPDAAIDVECRSRTTRENARFTRPMFAAGKVKRAIIVTSWYHSRRALSTFRTLDPGIEFASMPAYRSGGIPASATLFRIYKEYAKIAWYWVRWGVPPWTPHSATSPGGRQETGRASNAAKLGTAVEHLLRSDTGAAVESVSSVPSAVEICARLATGSHFPLDFEAVGCDVEGTTAYQTGNVCGFVP